MCEWNRLFFLEEIKIQRKLSQQSTLTVWVCLSVCIHTCTYCWDASNCYQYHQLQFIGRNYNSSAATTIQFNSIHRPQLQVKSSAATTIQSISSAATTSQFIGRNYKSTHWPQLQFIGRNLLSIDINCYQLPSIASNCICFCELWC